MGGHEIFVTPQGWEPYTRARRPTARSLALESSASKKAVHRRQRNADFFPKGSGQAWIKRREAELQQPKAIGVVNLSRVTIDEILEACVKEALGVMAWERTKTADITRLRESVLSNIDAHYLTAADIIEYAWHRRTVDEAGPATVLNDIIWLRQCGPVQPELAAAGRRRRQQGLARDEDDLKAKEVAADDEKAGDGARA